MGSPTNNTPATDTDDPGTYTRAVVQTPAGQAQSKSEFDTAGLHDALGSANDQVSIDNSLVGSETKVTDNLSGTEKQDADPNQLIIDDRARAGDAGYHQLGIGSGGVRSATAYDDKNAVLGKVGNPGDTARNDAEAKLQQQKLAGVQQTLAQNDPSAFDTSDELLKYGQVGLQFFHDFLPAYNNWTGADYSYDDFVTEYKFDYGIKLSAFVKDAQLLQGAATTATAVAATLDKASTSLFPTWEGTAASQFSTAMKSYAAGDKTVSDTLNEAGQGILDVALAMEKVLYTKAATVSAMYTATLTPGIYGIQALNGMINVARNTDDDASKRWVLGTFHLKMSGLHDHDTDQDMWDARDALDDPSRQLAINTATSWLNEVLKPQVDARIKLFDQVNKDTQSSIQKLFGTLAGDFQAVKDPYTGMSSKHLADDSKKINIVTTPAPGTGGTSPQGAVPGVPAVPGTSTPGTSTPGTSTPGTPTPGTPTPGTPTPGTPTPGTTTPESTTPGTPTPGTPTPGTPTPGTPTPGTPTTPTVSTPGVPTPTSPDPTTPTTPTTPTMTTTPDPTGTNPTLTDPTGTNPSVGMTNPDGSVTTGADGGLQVSTKNPDGSFSITQTGADGLPHQYHVAFGPDGQPTVTPADAGTGSQVPGGLGTDGSTDPSASFSDVTGGSDAHATTPAVLHTNHDGSVSIGAHHDLTVGNDKGGQGFTMTQTVGGQAHDFQVTYDHAGHPHVTEVADGTGNDASGFTPSDAAVHDNQATGGSGDGGSGAGSGTDTAAFSGAGGGGAAGHGGGGGDTSGGGADGGAAGGATSGQIGVGDRFGATAAASASASPADATVGAATPAAAEHGGSGGVGGMPMGMGGMGRGAGGGAGGEELKHRYQPAAENVIDEAELEEWDRLGPTIG